MPKGLQNALWWNKHDPYLESDNLDDVAWQIVEPMLHKKTAGTQGHGGENGSDTLKMMPCAESSDSWGGKVVHIEKSISEFTKQQAKKEEKVTSSSLPGP